jgi:beta-lactamase regulating signal transducer with metallopeptidase domain
MNGIGLEYLRTFPAWLWEASWQGTLLATVVLVIQWILRKQLSAHWRSALWLLVLARLLLPSLPAARFSAYNWLPRNRPPALSPVPSWSPPPGPIPNDVATYRFPGESIRLSYEAPPPKPATPAIRPFPLPSLPIPPLTLVWLAGCLVISARTFTAYARLAKKVSRLRVDAPEILTNQFDDAKAELKVNRAELLISEAVAAPLVTGLWKTRVVLPPGLEEKLSPDDIRMILLHELAHVKRGDLWMTWLSWLAATLHWFNPAVRFVLMLARKDREMACDERVLRLVSDSKAYGAALIRFMELHQEPMPSPGFGAIGIFESKSALIQRVRRIAAYRPPTFLAPLIGFAVLIIVGIFTLTKASDQKAAPTGAPLLAQASAGPIVRSIDIPDIGAGAINKEMILANMGAHVGQPYSEKIVEEDIRNLQNRFNIPNLRIFGEPLADGVKIIVVLNPKWQQITDVQRERFRNYRYGEFVNSKSNWVFAYIDSIDTIKSLADGPKVNLVQPGYHFTLGDASEGVTGSQSIEYTPRLYEAIERGDPTSVRDLLKRGAMPNLPKNDESHLFEPLEMSVTVLARKLDDEKRRKIVQILLEYGANPNPKRRDSRSLLFLPVANGTVDLVKFLIDAGIDPRKDADGGKALREEAERHGSDEMKSLINMALLPIASPPYQNRLSSVLAARLAALLANTEAKRQYDTTPFDPLLNAPTFSKGRWRWQANAGFGKGDLQADVSFTRLMACAGFFIISYPAVMYLWMKTEFKGWSDWPHYWILLSSPLPLVVVGSLTVAGGVAGSMMEHSRGKAFFILAAAAAGLVAYSLFARMALAKLFS